MCQPDFGKAKLIQCLRLDSRRLHCGTNVPPNPGLLRHPWGVDAAVDGKTWRVKGSSVKNGTFIGS